VFVTFTPEDTGEVQRFEFKPGRIRSSRAEMIEKKYAKLAGEKLTYDQFKMAVAQGSAIARRVLLWHVLNTVHPTLRIEDVDPFEDEILVEYSRTELEELRAEIVKAKGLDDEQREAIVARLDQEIETAPDDDGGKAPSKNSEPGTGAP
jgi:hypothetical protein